MSHWLKRWSLVNTLQRGQQLSQVNACQDLQSQAATTKMIYLILCYNLVHVMNDLKMEVGKTTGAMVVHAFGLSSWMAGIGVFFHLMLF